MHLARFLLFTLWEEKQVLKYKSVPVKVLGDKVQVDVNQFRYVPVRRCQYHFWEVPIVVVEICTT